jgi:hypothetical protein
MSGFGAHDHPIANPGDVCGGTGQEASGCGGVLEYIDGYHGNIRWHAWYGALDQVGSGIEVDYELMSGSAFELRREFAQPTRRGASGHHIEFSGVNLTHRRHDQRQAQYQGGRNTRELCHDTPIAGFGWHSNRAS